MLRDIIELALSYVQHLILLVSIAPRFFPQFYTSPTEVLKYLNLDLSSFLNEGGRGNNVLDITIPEIVPLDVRLWFLAVSVVIPLIINVVGLFALTKKLFFIWFLVLVAGVLGVTVGIVRKFVNDPWIQGVISLQFADGALYGGGGLVAVCLLALAGYMLVLRMGGSKDTLDEKIAAAESGLVTQAGGRSKNTRGRGSIAHQQIEKAMVEGFERKNPSDTNNSHLSREAAQASYDAIMLKEVENINAAACIERAAYFLVFLVTGLLLLQAFVVAGPLATQSDVVNRMRTAAGVLFCIAASMALVWLCLGFVRSGRIWQFHARIFVRDNFVSALLLIVSAMYIPAVANVIVIFNCERMSCGSGLRLPDARSTVSIGVTADNPCEPCRVAEVVQRCAANFSAALCVATESSRLRNDPAVLCSDVEKYFWPASAIIFMAFVLSVPVLNFLLTRTSTASLDTDFPVDQRQVEGFSEEEVYDEKVHLSDNVAKFIYDPFQRRYKHWRLLFIFQKLGIVVVSVFTFNVPTLSSEALGIILSLLIHFFVLLYGAIARPFTRRVENIFSSVTQFFLCCACALGLSAATDQRAPEAVATTVAVLAYVVPVMSLAVGAMLTFRDDMALEERRDDKSRRARHTVKQVEADGGTAGADGAAPEAPDTTDANVFNVCRTVDQLANKSRQHFLERLSVQHGPTVHGSHSPAARLEALRKVRPPQKGPHDEVSVPVPQAPTSPSDAQNFSVLHNNGSIAAPTAFVPPSLVPASMSTHGRQGNGQTPRRRQQSQGGCARAQENWRRTREVLLEYVRKRRAQRTEEDEMDDLALSQRPLNVSGQEVQGGMKAWDKLLVQLLKANRKKNDREQGIRRGRVDDDLRTGAAGKRQQLQLRVKLKEIYEKHLMRLIGTQRAVDFQINRTTIYILVFFFVFCGVCTVIALSCSFLGIMSSDQGTRYFTAGTTFADESAEYQLLGYASWDSFASHCCCMPFPNISASWPYYAVAAEKWVCNRSATGDDSSRWVVKERVRAVLQGGRLITGFAVRSLCGMSFDANCTLNRTAIGTVQLTGCSSFISADEKKLY